MFDSPLRLRSLRSSRGLESGVNADGTIERAGDRMATDA
jgi:hypothetical protein